MTMASSSQSVRVAPGATASKSWPEFSASAGHVHGSTQTKALPRNVHNTQWLYSGEPVSVID
jgi:hypothetical protein